MRTRRAPRWPGLFACAGASNHTPRGTSLPELAEFRSRNLQRPRFLSSVQGSGRRLRLLNRKTTALPADEGGPMTRSFAFSLLGLLGLCAASAGCDGPHTTIVNLHHSGVSRLLEHTRPDARHDFRRRVQGGCHRAVRWSGRRGNRRVVHHHQRDRARTRGWRRHRPCDESGRAIRQPTPATPTRSTLRSPSPASSPR